jgi:hypothetical protein
MLVYNIYNKYIRLSNKAYENYTRGEGTLSSGTCGVPSLGSLKFKHVVFFARRETCWSTALIWRWGIPISMKFHVASLPLCHYFSHESLNVSI